MTTATGKTIRRLRSTGRGSNFYGDCEICFKPVIDTEIETAHRRGTADLYVEPPSVGHYGHEEYLIDAFGPVSGDNDVSPAADAADLEAVHLARATESKTGVIPGVYCHKSGWDCHDFVLF